MACKPFVDCIIPCLDEIRQNAADATGMRRYRVFLRTETWTGGEKGSGNRVVSEVEIRPRPRVVFPPVQKSFYIEAGGRDETAEVLLDQISLTYAEETLLPTGLSANQDFMYRLTDAHATASLNDRYYVPFGTPRPDYLKTLSWQVFLKQRSQP